MSAAVSLPPVVPPMARARRRLPVVAGDLGHAPSVAPPRTRGECAAGVPRPCPFAGECRHGLPGASSPDATCSLDVADQHPDGMTLEEVATLLGFSGEHVRRIEEKALEKLWRTARKLAPREHGEEDDFGW